MRILKLFVFSLFAFVICLSMLNPINASERNTMVYASEADQNEIFSALNNPTFDYYAALKANNLSIVKESITVVYTASLLEYADSGSFRIEPMTVGSKKNCVYIAKVVTKEGAYAGNIKFYINNNVAYNLLFSPSTVLPEYYTGVTSPRYIASCSYADHARRIQGIYKRTTFISVDKIRYVVIDGIVEGFFVNDGDMFSIIPVGYISETELETVDLNMTSSDLAVLAFEYRSSYNKQLKEKEEWQKQHPGEQWSYTGQHYNPIISGASTVDNINNIYDYLEIPRSSINAEELAAHQFIKVIIPILCIVTLSMFFIKVRKAIKKT